MTNSIPNSKRFFLIIQLATVSVFLGRAWQHWRWDAPFRTLLWDEQWMSPIISGLFGWNWIEYIQNPAVDQFIQGSIRGVGVLYFLCALAALGIKKLPRISRIVLWMGAFSLILLALLYCKERFFSVGQFFEYSLQCGSPLLLIYLSKKASPSKNLLLAVKLAIAATFTAHGLYALGYYPRPVHFMEMTMNILGVGEESAILFLNAAGVLDLIISFGIFLPWRWAKYCLGYAVFWGLATTVARVWAYFNWEWLGAILEQWLHESVMRFPHFLIPLAVLLYLYFPFQKKKSDTIITTS